MTRWCRRCAAAAVPGLTTGTLYQQRNRIERLFRRLKGYRRIFRFDKLDVLHLGFLGFAL